MKMSLWLFAALNGLVAVAFGLWLTLVDRLEGRK